MQLPNSYGTVIDTVRKLYSLQRTDTQILFTDTPCNKDIKFSLSTPNHGFGTRGPFLRKENEKEILKK